MPVMIDPRERTSSREALEGRNYDNLYRDLYPDGINLKPGSETHERLKEELLSRARDSERFMSDRHPKWTDIDDILTTYIPLDKYEKKLKAKDVRKPVSIVIPESYATLETILTYMMAAFGESPIFRYTGAGPEDLIGTILLEKVIESQTHRSKALLALHTHFRDAFTYGVGIVSVVWNTKMGRRSTFEDVGSISPLDGTFIKTGVERVVQDYMTYEGSEIQPIDPYRYLPDPGVPLHDVQAGEYVGWVDREQYISLLREEGTPGSFLFNVKYLRNINSTSSVYKSSETERDMALRYGLGDPTLGANTQPVDVIRMYWDVIPKEFGLGPEETPRKWLFYLAGDQVIIAAHEMDLDHNMFPVAVCAPDFGGHELMPISRLEVMYGLQEVINFYFNSDVANVRKMLYGMYVIDPKMINQYDFNAPSHRKIIRTRGSFWGKSIDQGIKQLEVHDVTAGHLARLGAVKELSRNMTGAVDSLQGLQRTGGERVTKAEFQDTRMSALSRLQKAARLISLQSMYDMALMYASHSQQFMSQEQYVRTTGRWEYDLRVEYGLVDGEGNFPKWMNASPSDIDVFYDVFINDGSIEGGEYADTWVTLYQIIAGSPELMAELDITRIFMHIARLLKAQNIQDFVRSKQPIQAQTVPDEQALEMAQRGETAPIEEVI